MPEESSRKLAISSSRTADTLRIHTGVHYTTTLGSLEAAFTQLHCFKSAMIPLWDKDKFEVTLRAGLMCLGGFSLSIAVIPTVVPPSLALLPGVLVCSLSYAFPKLMWALGLFTPVLIVAMLQVMAGATMLLAAASVSDGCFIGVFSAYTLAYTSLYFGKLYSVTGSLANVYISVGGLMGMSFLPLVQKYGLQVVALMWTEKGTENQLAVWRNLLICVCWACACVALGILLPPWRTSRQMISRFQLPEIFKQVNRLLAGEDIDVKELYASKASLKGGNVVAMSFFEPHLFHPYVDLVTPLKQIVVATDELIFKSLLVLKWKEGLTDAPNEFERVVLDDTVTLLGECGKALSSNAQVDYDTLRDFLDGKVFDRMTKVGSLAGAAESANPELSSSNYIYQQALEVQKHTLEYLRAFNRGVVSKTTKEKLGFHLKRAVVNIAAPLLPALSLLKASTLLFHPKKWNWKDILWCIELSAGFIALISMTIYWKKYADFRIVPKDNYVGPGKCFIPSSSRSAKYIHRVRLMFLCVFIFSLQWLAVDGLCFCMATHARRDSQERNHAYFWHGRWWVRWMAGNNCLQLVIRRQC